MEHRPTGGNSYVALEVLGVDRLHLSRESLPQAWPLHSFQRTLEP